MKSKFTKVILRFDDIKSFKDAVKTLSKNRTIFDEGGKRKIELIASQIEDIFVSKLLGNLRRYPPVRDRTNKVRWKSAKQRRYVMMLASKGIIKLPYVRTNKLGEGWDVRIEIVWTRQNKIGIIRIIVGNEVDYVKFVMGNIGLGVSRKSIEVYRKPIQPFHLDTGWHLAYRSISEAFSGIKQYASEKLSSWDSL